MATGTAEHNEGAVPGTNGTAEPGGHTGAEGGTAAPPVQAAPKARAVAKSVDQDEDDSEFGKGFRKGARSAKREFHEELEREQGAKLQDILTEWKAYREAHSKGEKAESAEVTKLQRQLAQAQEAQKQKDAKISELFSENTSYKVTAPIKDAVARVHPKSEKYAAYFVTEMQRRVKLDDDGELTVLSPEGKPQHKLSLDDLAKELAEAMPDLVTPPRTGTGVRPAAPSVQSRESSNGNGQMSRQDRINALARLTGR